MPVSKFAARARQHKPTAGRIIPRPKPCPVADSLFANIPAGARKLVRLAHNSADKTVFIDGCEQEASAAQAEAAGYLAPLGSSECLLRITARGEAYLAARLRAD